MKKSVNIFATMIFLFVSSYLPRININGKDLFLTEIINTKTNNLAPNPSFEEGFSNPDGWSTKDAYVSYYWSSTEAHSGNRSVCINEIQPYARGEWFISENIPVEPGDKIRLSGWAKGNEGGEAYHHSEGLGINLYTDSGNSPAGAGGSFDSIDSSWKYISIEMVVPIDLNISSAKISLGSHNIYGEYLEDYWVCFDDVSFEILKDETWTLIYYLAGDNDLEASVSSEYKNIFQSRINKNVNIAVFLDVESTNARYHAITPSGPEEILWMGELNTGDPSTLINFINWAKLEYSADHYALIISAHGHALGGVAPDSSTYLIDDKLTPKEIKDALTGTGSFDVIYMNSCLMGNLEIEYNLRGTSKYYVASEALKKAPDLHNLYINWMTGNTSPEDLAIKIASSFKDRFINTEVPATISVVDLSLIENVAQKASYLAEYIYNLDKSNKEKVWNVIDASTLQRFDGNEDFIIDNNDKLADLYHFAVRVRDLGIIELGNIPNELITALEEYIIYNAKNSGPIQNGYFDHENAHGVSVTISTSRISFYTDSWLDFAEGANWNNLSQNLDSNKVISSTLQWGPMMVDLINEFNPDEPDTPNPPDPVKLIVRLELFLPVIYR